MCEVYIICLILMLFTKTGLNLLQAYNVNLADFGYQT